MIGGIFQPILNSAATPHPEKNRSTPDKLQHARWWLKQRKLAHFSGWLVAIVLLFLSIQLLSMPTVDIEFLPLALLVAVSLLSLSLITKSHRVGIPYMLFNYVGSNP